MYASIPGKEFLSMNPIEHFSGIVMVYGCPVEIDTADGSGFAEVLDRMSAFLNGFSKWADPCLSIDDCDMRQEAHKAALEGILVYRPYRGAQLSTFLHTHVRNRMTDIRRRHREFHVPVEEGADALIVRSLSPEDRIAVIRAVESWKPKWRRIIFRLLMRRDKIRDVARDEGMSPWGLTRAVRRMLRKTRDIC